MPKAGKITIGIVLVLVVIFFIGSYALDRYLLGETYKRIERTTPTLTLTDADIEVDYPSDTVDFTLDGNTLRGRVYGVDNTRGLVVFRHGIFSQHQDYLALIMALVDKGWKVFAYDAIGCGESDGDSVIGFAQSPLDVHAAVQFARESGIAGDLPILLFGHSWGAYGVAGSLDFDDGVKACVALSGFDSSTGIIMESTEKQAGALAATQFPTISLIGMMDFGANAGRSATDAINKSGIPVLIVHGTDDAIISYSGNAIIAQRDRITNPNVRYITIDTPGRNGHNSYFYSPESQAYLNECSERLQALMDEYPEGIPSDVLEEFMASVDKRRANTADPELINQADELFSQAIQS